MSGLVDEHGEPLQPHHHPVDADAPLRLRDALGSAYTAAFAMNQPRSEVLKELSRRLKDEAVAELLPGYISNLEATVKARSIGNRCGDFISQQQLGLLKDAMKE